jgi:hypothetical protein
LAAERAALAAVRARLALAGVAALAIAVVACVALARGRLQSEGSRARYAR